MFLIIGIYGARSRKVKAALYFFFYTLFGSLVMLLGLLYLLNITSDSTYNYLLNSNYLEYQEMVI